ncbi:hypothetical protein GR157_10215 [Burkholderia sp. 4701]|nr:hypothetical protein [Burkholderia sp. 4701]MXN82270.1 hypothetical protein [Burkholderia sp. 4812]
MLLKSDRVDRKDKGHYAGETSDARALCNAAMEPILGQNKPMSSIFCALHNADNLSTKQRVSCAFRKRFQRMSHMLRRAARNRRRTNIGRK